MTLLALSAIIRAQTIERQIRQFGDHTALSRPVGLSLSPSGTVFAVADQSSDRIFVIDTQGSLLWEVGEMNRISQPSAVCMTGDNELLFAESNHQAILHAGSADPRTIDTVVDLSAFSDDVKSINRLVRGPKGDFIVMDQSRSQVLSFGSDWKLKKIIAAHGQGKGKIWSPTDVTSDLGGDVAVSDSRNFPMQLFSPDGVALFAAGWSTPLTQRGWEASAIAIDQQRMYWVSDYAESRWRLFDRAGNEVGKRPFDVTVIHPIASVFTPDNKMIVLDEIGAVLIFGMQ